MINEMQEKILVIGSKVHSRSTCVNWLEPFPNIEEFDYVIINMQSLTQELFDKLFDKDSNKLLNARKEIKTFFDTGREIFCIINKYITRSHVPGQPKTFAADVYIHHNYDWLFLPIELKSKAGTSIVLKDERFKDYLKNVGKWDYEIELAEEAIKQMFVTAFYDLFPIALNKSKKIIAGTVCYGGILGEKVNKKGKGKIHLLPQPTKCSLDEAIEILIDIIGTEKRVEYEWRKSIEVPGIRDVEEEIGKCDSEIERIKEIKIVELNKKWEELDKYRDLLTSNGRRLEKAVQNALLVLGIKTEETEEGFPVDLLGDNVAIEVTGTAGKIDTKSEKFNQIIRFIEDYRKNEKVILVANTYKRLKPEDRKGKMNFTPEVEDFLENRDVCLLTSQTLFELWKDVKNGDKKKEFTIKKILDTRGELH